MNSAWEPQKKEKNVRVHVFQKKKKEMPKCIALPKRY